MFEKHIESHVITQPRGVRQGDMTMKHMLERMVWGECRQGQGERKKATSKKGAWERERRERYKRHREIERGRRQGERRTERETRGRKEERGKAPSFPFPFLSFSACLPASCQLPCHAKPSPSISKSPLPQQSREGVLVRQEKGTEQRDSRRMQYMTLMKDSQIRSENMTSAARQRAHAPRMVSAPMKPPHCRRRQWKRNTIISSRVEEKKKAEKSKAPSAKSQKMCSERWRMFIPYGCHQPVGMVKTCHAGILNAQPAIVSMPGNAFGYWGRRQCHNVVGWAIHITLYHHHHLNRTHRLNAHGYELMATMGWGIRHVSPACSLRLSSRHALHTLVKLFIEMPRPQQSCRHPNRVTNQ